MSTLTQEILAIPTHMTVKERRVLFDCARTLPPGSCVVEIGSYLGASTACLAAGVAGNGGHVFAIDPWNNHGMSEGPRDTFAEFRQNIARFDKTVTPLRGWSADVAQTFDTPIDLLFIDGDHSYEGIVADFRAWLEKLKPGAIVALHDHRWCKEIQRAAREFIVPLQTEGGRRADTLYWTRVDPRKRDASSIAASVIVPTFDRPDHLAAALDTLTQQDVPADQYEILVVDNAPGTAVEAMVESVNSRCDVAVRYIAEHRVGLHEARHAGARAARGRILAYVDDDIVASPGWLRAVIDAFQDPSVGAVAGRILPQWEGPQPGWLDQFKPAYLSLLDLGDEPCALRWPRTAFGCNMAVRRDVLFEVGGFNPDAIGDRRRIWLRGDGETGLNKKIYDAGHAIVYVPGACVHHRIDTHRLQPGYFCWRLFIQGITDAYAQFRERPWRAPLVRDAGQGLFNALRCYLTSCVQRDDPKARADAWYWYGRARHQLQTLISPRLCAHVMRETYL